MINKIKKLILQKWLLLSLICLVPFTSTAAIAPKNNKVPITWQSVYGAQSYTIVIKNSAGTPIVATTTQSNKYVAQLTHGVYAFNITAHNSQKEVIGSSKWQEITVKSWKLVNENFWYVATGVAWNPLIGNPNSNWNDVYNSTISFTGYIARDLPKTSFLAAEMLYEYESYDSFNKAFEASTMTLNSLYGGVLFYTKMNHYFTAGFRVAPGISYTSITKESDSQNGVNFGFLLGVAFRANYRLLFIEHGIEYKQTFFSGGADNPSIKILRPYFRGGVRF